MSIDLEMEEILKVFFEEGSECLSAMESGLLTLDAHADRETINTIFRAAHSIKGGAGTFGLMEISHFTHAVETLLDQMRNGTRAVSAEAVQILLQSVDVIREMLDAAAAKQPIPAASAAAVTAQLEQLLATVSPPVEASPPAAATASAEPASLAQATPAEPAPPAPGLGWRIEFRPDASLFKTCNDPLRMFAQLSMLGELTATPHLHALPGFDELDPTLCLTSWTLILLGPMEKTQVEEIFDWVDANSAIEIEPLDPPSARDAAPVAAPLVAAVPAAAPAPARVRESAPAAAPAAAPVAPPAAASPARMAPDAGSIRVGTEKVDALINLVGELVITQSMLSRFVDHCDLEDLEALRRGLIHLSRNTRELQESVLKIRMLPISFSFNRFPRLVHELSRKLGKKVELKMNGEQTELDKTVLEKIADPLVHLARNSLDHGLETPEQRAAAGKCETGTLELNAYHEGGSIIIEVKDDGAGINKSRVLAKARARGLVEPDANLSDDQIHNLIFLPGFSTAETVSDVSGRGVGMDVVRRNINDIGGHVHITSAEGAGTAIRIRLPLTLAILEGQMLRVGTEIYVVSLISIIETVQPTREEISSVVGQMELLRHRGDYLPIIRLHELFGVQQERTDLTEGLLVVVEADGQRAALVVDELLAQQQVVIKSLDTNFKHVQGLAGATIHGDGTVALIIDVPGVIRNFVRQQAGRVGRAA